MRIFPLPRGTRTTSLQLGQRKKAYSFLWRKQLLSSRNEPKKRFRYERYFRFSSLRAATFREKMRT